MVQPVAFCISGNVQFFETPNGIQASVDENPLVPIKGDIPTASEGMTVAERIKSLVESAHLWIQPSSTKVCLIKPSLEQVASFDIPSYYVYCVGKSGGIYYACENTLFKWDPLQQTNIPTSYQARELRAIAELPNGELIVGDDAGFLHFPDGSKKQFFPVEIRYILPLSSTRYILSSSNGKRAPSCIVDLEKRGVIQQLESFNPLVVEEDAFVTDFPLCLWKYKLETEKYHIEKDFKVEDGLECIASKSKVVLWMGNDKVRIVDLWTGKQSTVYDRKIGVAAERNLVKFLENEETFFHYSGGYKEAHITRNSFRKGMSPQRIEMKGPRVLSILPLKSVAATLCVTGPNPSHIYLISNADGTIICEDNQQFITKTDDFQEAFELPDGLILLKFWSRLLLLRLNPSVEQRYKKRGIKQGTGLSAKRVKASISPSYSLQGNSLIERAKSLEDPDQKTYGINDKGKLYSYYFDCSADEGSSE